MEDNDPAVPMQPKKLGEKSGSGNFCGARRHGRFEDGADSPRKKIASLPALGKCRIPENQAIVNMFEKMVDFYSSQEMKGNAFRALLTRKAISAVRECDEEIVSGDHAMSLFPGIIGKRGAAKIEELRRTGSSRKANQIQNREKENVLSQFIRIWGVGTSTAEKWWNRGYRSLDDVQTLADLSHSQKIGLRYLKEFEIRIPRDEVSAIEKIVRREAEKLVPGIEVVTCGSYRRGSETCGDVDILFTHPKSDDCIQGFISVLIKRLHEIDFLTDDLSHDPAGEASSYMGVCHLPSSKIESSLNQASNIARKLSIVDRSDIPGIHRRIDLKAYQRHQFPYALLYFTGNDLFNRSMRLLARKRGLCLSDKGLRRSTVDLVSDTAVVVVPIPAQARSENDIFDALGVEYLEPSERNYQ